MAEENTTPKAAAAQGAGEADLNPSEGGQGNPEPKKPDNKPPEPEQTPEEKAEAEAKAKAEAEAAAAAEAEGNEEGNEEGNDEKPLDTDVWGSTGDEVGDSTLTLMQNADLTVEDAKAIMYDAVKAGDVTKIDKDALVEKVGKAKADLILAGVENFVSRAKAKADTILKEVHTTAGGKENWDQVTTWAKENVPESEMAEYRELVDAGGAKARFAAQELMSRFNADDNNTTLNADSAEITPDTKAQSQGRKITKRAYAEELMKAHDRGASPAEIEEINAARRRGRAAGI